MTLGESAFVPSWVPCPGAGQPVVECRDYPLVVDGVTVYLFPDRCPVCGWGTPISEDGLVLEHLREST
jgi:hypothetical protein